jgi:hypothetical protein
MESEVIISGFGGNIGDVVMQGREFNRESGGIWACVVRGRVKEEGPGSLSFV